MRFFPRPLPPALLFLALLCAFGPPRLAAQDAPAGPSPAQIAAEIKPLRHKTLILVFDVTQSTRHGGDFTQERTASATLLRQGCSPGDRVILLPFGTGYRAKFDTVLRQPSDVDGLIDQLPAAPAPGRGTDIRWPHHEALKLIARGDLCPAVVVLLTDSFNDRPDLSDPNYPKYRAYYTLKGLTVYPDTPENRDYVRLLRALAAKGCLHQYGVGVALAPDGRPIERLPVGPGQGDSDAGTTTQAPTIMAPIESGGARSLLPLLLGLALGLLLLLLALWFLLRRRPVPVRLRLGDTGLPRDYRLAPGAKLALGGPPGAILGSQDTFPLAGLSAPVAFILAGPGGPSLVPLPPGLGIPSAALFHNGLPVQQHTPQPRAPLRAGDELRVSVPPSDTDAGREHRIRVEDPRGPAF